MARLPILAITICYLVLEMLLLLLDYL